MWRNGLLAAVSDASNNSDFNVLLVGGHCCSKLTSHIVPHNADPSVIHTDLPFSVSHWSLWCEFVRSLRNLSTPSPTKVRLGQVQFQELA